MPQRQKHYILMAAAGLGVAALLAMGLLALRPIPAQAQGSLSVPACQCSAPTSILNMSTSVAQCLCGNATCVISQETGSGKSGTNLMQCVR